MSKIAHETRFDKMLLLKGDKMKEDTRKIEIMEAVNARNEEIAAKLNQLLSDKGVFTINVMGAPGAGKTTSLVNMIQRLDRKCFVIEGDIESDIDTKKLHALGIETVQINTGGACHLDSPLIEGSIRSFELEEGYLFIENIGNLVCPAEFAIGEHIKLLISSVTEGSDKPYKYPLAFEKADIILLNKTDLIEHIDFDEDSFLQGVRRLNPCAPVFRVSGKSGIGFKEVSEWIIKKASSCLNR